MRVSSLPTPKQITHHFAESGKLPRHAPTHHKAVAIVVEPEPWRNPQSPVGREIPCQHRRKIMRRIPQPETMAVAQAPIQFQARDKILPAKSTTRGGSLKTKRGACGQHIAEP